MFPTVKKIDQLAKLIPLRRRQLKSPAGRRRRWRKNRKNFPDHVSQVIKLFPQPSRWRRQVVASQFLTKREIRPYDNDAWSTTDIIAATKKQGFEILMFINAARNDFLSLPALVPLITHEMAHVGQLIKNPKLYNHSIFRDDQQWLETEAEAAAARLPDIFREEWMLESVLYCYDQWGWPGAAKMADYLHTHIQKQYGGGYNSGMTRAEYGLFLDARRGGKISDFIAHFPAKTS